ncbi:hypothetical protein JOF56_001937 [Kibdelosporangium banguiense]|uniref:Pentapeptide repeat-containing protein n=1 Tax=Kibdelosporangium banguiense TaxID=1365924 RepID=A0ABS4TAW7_9PSEU|nr:pentapeptide repeat-containing protein [Kibdelosporangium banguiense]MBP2321552.1 hypothetical protein [Kibdelosporangium banguiense]
MVAAAGVVAAVAWGATAWLLGEANQAKDPAAARVEAIKTGLSIGAGTGGVFALLLAVRRQWHQELTAAATNLDAAEKRVTELYTKAADQLGSDKAPVRLAGLYALERVAQNNPDQRQTIVNVLCAYLRMPYTPRGNKPADDADQDVIKNYIERTQEREVRLTAQRLLTEHLSPGDGGVTAPVATFWADISLDLTYATLITFSLANCVVETAVFRLATFNGSADFWSATFNAMAGFQSATFNAMAGFQSATFNGSAGFRSATFNAMAGFRSATFNAMADFQSATFKQAVPREIERFTSPASQGGDVDGLDASENSTTGS